jgi:hypothetical protein
MIFFSGRTSAFTLWRVNLSALAALAGTFLFVVPRLTPVFDDFRVRLPGITMVVLNVARFPAVVIAGTTLFLAAQVLVYTQSGENRSLFLIAFTLLLLGMVGAVVLALGMPLMELSSSAAESGASGG